MTLFSESTRPANGLVGVAALALLALSACSTSDIQSSAQQASQAASQSQMQDIFGVYSDGATVIGKTDYAEVVRVKLPANASIPSHQGGDRVILSLDDYSISFAKTGEVDNVRFEEGTVHFHPAGIHRISNTGSNTAEFVVFERLSGAALPEGEPTADEDDTPTPDTGATEEKSLSNDAFDVYKVAIAPGGKLAPHKGFARAVYSLDDYKIDFHEDGQTKTRTFAAGEVHFHEPGNHWLKNAGETPADFVVVDYKR